MEKIKNILKREIKDSNSYLKQFFERCRDGSVYDLDWVIVSQKSMVLSMILLW